ncbi:MAG: hypothetical protein NTW97_08805 [Candidatus Krumholzibacteria bacterium]|nr:hypothetical protein [Candidatus Krumholzibacteria bacterium]
MRHLLALVALVVVATDATAGELVEIDLPQLEGTYCFDTCDPSRLVDFQLDRLPLAIEGVCIHISGIVSVGQEMCDLYGDGSVTGPFPYPMALVAWMMDTVGGHPWFAGAPLPDESGSFDMVVSFRELYGWPVTWDFLLSGHVNFSFAGEGSGLIPECWVTDLPQATVEHASLIIEGEFEVAVEQSTWGSIKSLF